MRELKRFVLMLAMALALSAAGCAADKTAKPAVPQVKVTSAVADPDPARFAKEIEKFRQLDAAAPPKAGGILFTGSSTIRMWDTDKWFPGMNVVNRGFGGSQISDVNHYLDTVVFAHRPAKIVFYCGGNDINAGKSAEQVYEDFQQFASAVHAKLPAAKIYFMSNNPSPKRWEQRQTQQKMNDLVKRHAAADPRIVYINTYDALLSPDGTPRVELFRTDKLHLSEPGYEIVTKIVKDALAKR